MEDHKEKFKDETAPAASGADSQSSIINNQSPAGKPELSEHLSRTKRDNYRKVALNYMSRNVHEIADRAGGSILRHYPGGGIHSVFLNGYEDGFARAVELIISGKLALKESEVIIPKPQQPSEEKK